MTASSPWLLSFELASPSETLTVDYLPTLTCEGRTVALHGSLDEPLTSSAEGHPHSDIRQILAGFQKRGLDVLADLRGSYVVALADASAQYIVVARDALGMHPLFWTQSGTRVLFSDSIQALLRHSGVSRDLNRVALADHLCHRWPDARETFFSAIKRVPPGSAFQARNGAFTISRYWDPAPIDRQIRWTADDEDASFKALLERSVDRCTRKQAAAVFLSGGLDSISVAAAAADRARSQHIPAPTALSLAMADPACDERRAQVAVAQSLGLDQHLIPFDDAVGRPGFVRRGLDLGAALSSPLLNVWGPAYESLGAIAARNGVRTILTGSGGDEWLSVSPYLSADLIAARKPAEWWRFYRTLRRSYNHSALTHARFATWTYGLRPLASRRLHRIAGETWQRRRRNKMVGHDPQWISPDQALRTEQIARADGALESADPPQGFYLREVRTGLDHPLTSWELEEQYEVGQRLGVQHRHPYWDQDLVDMLYRTPPARLSRGGRAKGLVRDDLARRFPGLGLDRQRKVSATQYLARLLDTELPAAAAHVGDCTALSGLGVISADAARSYHRPDFGRQTARWEMLSLETWVRAHQ